jgi:hypothetical protein
LGCKSANEHLVKSGDVIVDAGSGSGTGRFLLPEPVHKVGPGGWRQGTPLQDSDIQNEQRHDEHSFARQRLANSEKVSS